MKRELYKARAVVNSHDCLNIMMGCICHSVDLALVENSLVQTTNFFGPRQLVEVDFIFAYQRRKLYP